ncbi:putative U3 small nucleolar RNA-associated protein 11 [Neolecta irregularis DAH-3]|uniref:U3 small nucleolar RNA-associated protein 11 n=1 Tax=Neolecta irregularis (strain DAH-3) TaxID=1198029 RepID=A0A1U7LNE5_NEOID|nr:putative U3 small nucleolar RNA-associated protein 11 [Neolecta irregularis DAH-3]|eukprot:OLL24175.1 putative U3 small nucleolar RNA-associated protein 11 [Neolecta irregularis DAH-3]
MAKAFSKSLGSSIRTAHRERSQPHARRKWGLLEKPKDYRLRARDYHRKQDRLKALRKQAENRNPDEFYFGMMSEKTRNGVVVKQRSSETVLTAESMKLLRTQDAGYLRTMRAIEAKKLERMKRDLHFEEEDATNSGRRHVIFVDSEEQVKSFDPVEFFQTDEQSLNRTFNRPRKPQLSHPSFKQIAKIPLEKREKVKKAQKRAIEARSVREKELRKVETEMELQRNLLGKGQRRKLASGQYKWKAERKR